MLKCYVDRENALDGASRKVIEWAIVKGAFQEALVRAVIELHKGTRTKVIVGTHLSDEFEVNVGVHQG